MRQHLLAWGANAIVGSGGDVQLPAVAEQAFSQSIAGNFTIPVPLQAFAAYAGGISLTRARFNTGSLRARGFPQIYPLNLASLPPTPVALADWRTFPVPLHQLEDFRIDITSGVANQIVAGVWVTPDPINYNINNPALRWLRFTVTTTDLLVGWSAPVAIAFQDTLEGGVYDIYGMAAQSATGIFARLVIQGEFYRPGVLCQALNTAVPDDMFAAGTGKWASFNTYAPPQIEVLGSVAGADVINGWLLCGKSMAA